MLKNDVSIVCIYQPSLCISAQFLIHNTHIMIIGSDQPQVQRQLYFVSGLQPDPLLPGLGLEYKAAQPRGGRLPPHTTRHDALRALDTIKIYEKVGPARAR